MYVIYLIVLTKTLVLESETYHLCSQNSSITYNMKIVIKLLTDNCT